eukprot:54633-Pelagomonas_calceolata.AAC.6
MENIVISSYSTSLEIPEAISTLPASNCPSHGTCNTCPHTPTYAHAHAHKRTHIHTRAHTHTPQPMSCKKLHYADTANSYSVRSSFHVMRFPFTVRADVCDCEH